MTYSKQQNTEKEQATKKLEELLKKAIKKIGGSKENDVCRYLPVPTGGYMHHFTLRKMKHEAPEELTELVERFVISPDTPITVAPKPRAARGSRKRRDQITLSKTDLERMLNIARLAGDKEMIAKLTPKKSLAAIRRELMACIRKNEINYPLWTAFVEAVNVTQNGGVPEQVQPQQRQPGMATMPGAIPFPGQVTAAPAFGNVAPGMPNAVPAGQVENPTADQYATARLNPGMIGSET